MATIISKELQDALAENKAIESVAFDERGAHFFNFYPDKKTGKFFVTVGGLQRIVNVVPRSAILGSKASQDEAVGKSAPNGILPGPAAKETTVEATASTEKATA